MNMNQKKGSAFTLLTVLIIGILIGVRIGRADISIPATLVPATATSEQAASQTVPPGLTDPGPANTIQPAGSDVADSETGVPDENGQYHSKDDVARYLAVYGHLPSNYISKKTARDAGWDGGSLERLFPGCSIGGDVFRNREGLLPNAPGRRYYECDVDTLGKASRGAKRIVYSNDGLIYYTDDHYSSFVLLYGKAD